MTASVFALVGFVLWGLGAAIWRAQTDAHSRWFAVLMVSVGTGALGIAVHRLLMPWLQAVAAAPALYEAARIAFIGTLLVYFFVFAYASLMSAVMFARFVPRPVRVWAPRRGHALRTAAVTVLTNVWLYMSEYSVPGKQVIVGPDYFTHVRNAAWDYHLPMVWLVIGLIVFLGVHYGVLGVRMRIGRARVHGALRSSAAGSERLRQWLDGDLARLEADAQQLAAAVAAGEAAAAGRAANGLLASARRMQATVERLRRDADAAARAEARRCCLCGDRQRPRHRARRAAARVSAVFHDPGGGAAPWARPDPRPADRL